MLLRDLVWPRVSLSQAEWLHIWKSQTLLMRAGDRCITDFGAPKIFEVFPPFDSPLHSLLWRLALELTGLPLLELGGPLSWGGRASADPCGRLNLSFGLQVHCKQVTLCLVSQEPGCGGVIFKAKRREISAKLTHWNAERLFNCLVRTSSHPRCWIWRSKWSRCQR